MMHPDPDGHRSRQTRPRLEKDLSFLIVQQPFSDSVSCRIF